MDLNFGDWENYKNLEQQFISTSPNVQAALGIYRNGKDLKNVQIIPANVLYYLKNIEYLGKENAFNVLLNSVLASFLKSSMFLYLPL